MRINNFTKNNILLTSKELNKKPSFNARAIFYTTRNDFNAYEWLHLSIDSMCWEIQNMYRQSAILREPDGKKIELITNNKTFDEKFKEIIQNALLKKSKRNWLRLEKFEPTK